jgi:glucokinase
VSSLIDADAVHHVVDLAGTGTPSDGTSPDGVHVVGISVGESKLTAALADHHGDALVERSMPRGGNITSDVTELCRVLSDPYGHHKLAGVVVAIPATLHARITEHAVDAGRSQAAVDHLAREMSTELGCAVCIADATHLAVIGEHRSGVAVGNGTVALISVGATIDLGLLVNGQLMRRARGGPTNLGHLPIGPEPTGRASKRGAFELVATASGMRLAMATALERTPDSLLTMSATAAQILDAASLGDRVAVRLVDIEAELLAKAISSVAMIVDPDLVVLGGEIGAHRALIEPVRDAVSRLVPYPVEVVRAGLGDTAAMIGAVTVAVGRIAQA